MIPALFISGLHRALLYLVFLVNLAGGMRFIKIISGQSRKNGRNGWMG